MTSTEQMISSLRVSFGGLSGIDPSGPTYRRLCDLLDRADNDALKAAHAAKIKFVSALALNRMIRRGIA